MHFRKSWHLIRANICLKRINCHLCCASIKNGLFIIWAPSVELFYLTNNKIKGSRQRDHTSRLSTASKQSNGLYRWRHKTNEILSTWAARLRNTVTLVLWMGTLCTNASNLLGCRQMCSAYRFNATSILQLILHVFSYFMYFIQKPIFLSPIIPPLYPC